MISDLSRCPQTLEVGQLQLSSLCNDWTQGVIFKKSIISLLQKKKEMQIMKIKIIFLIVAMIRHLLAMIRQPQFLSGRIIAKVAVFQQIYHIPYFLLFYEYSKDQKETDLKIMSNNSETTRRKRESEIILLIFLVINTHGWPYHCEPPLLPQHYRKMG